MQKFVGQFGLKLKNSSSDHSPNPAFFSEESKGDTAVSGLAKGLRQHGYLFYYLTQSPQLSLV